MAQKQRMTRRIVSLWFPKLGIDRLARRMRHDWDKLPVVVITETGNRVFVTDLNTEAEQAGITHDLSDQPLSFSNICTAPDRKRVWQVRQGTGTSRENAWEQRCVEPRLQFRPIDTGTDENELLPSVAPGLFPMFSDIAA